MKNIIKKIKIKKYTQLIIGIIIGAVLAGTSVFYASTIYYDGINVGYDNNTSGLNADNVQDALDELDGKVNFGDATAANILSGKKALVGGTELTGTMTNNGAWSKSVSSTTAQTGGAGYYSSVSCAKAANSGTYTLNSKGSAVDMGANQNYRYVNTNNITASWVSKWSGSTTGNISVSLSGFSYAVIKITGGSYIMLQVGGAESCGAHRGTSPDGAWGNWMGGRCYKATTSGITATTNTMAGIEDKGASWISITNVWGIKNLS